MLGAGVSNLPYKEAVPIFQTILQAFENVDTKSKLLGKCKISHYITMMMMHTEGNVSLSLVFVVAHMRKNPNSRKNQLKMVQYTK